MTGSCALNWVLDLDGVVWLADDPIPGASAAVAELQARDGVVVFVTNNSFLPLAEVEAKLARHGIEATGSVVSSAMAAAALVEAGERVLVCGGPGVVEAVEERGAIAVANDAELDDPVDTVMVGFHRDFDYERMRRASVAVRGGARLVATNDDATYPTPLGPIPGAGAILAGIQRASGTDAVVAGKPYRPMADLLRRRLGSTGTVVGDRLDTDGRLARALGYRFALVLTGVTTPDAAKAAQPSPDDVAPDLATLVALGANSG
ncbi:MAG TPA: HAD-IIA family hydrolase [Acidimicrobiales bacterium]